MYVLLSGRVSYFSVSRSQARPGARGEEQDTNNYSNHNDDDDDDDDEVPAVDPSAPSEGAFLRTHRLRRRLRPAAHPLRATEAVPAGILHATLTAAAGRDRTR